MKLKTLIQEPAYDRVLDVLLDTAKNNGFKFAEPTPLISPFWKTTFTPSSSEAIFRHLDKSTNSSNKLYTVQPCIRVNDLPHLNDGWHSLLFHMVSFFLLDVNGIEDVVALILKAMTKATNLKLSDFYFTVPTNQYCPNSLSRESLGSDLLHKIGVSSDQMIWCAGSDNYQDNSLVTEEGQTVSMTGPKVEVFVKPPHQEKLYEVATCVLETAELGANSFGNVFACAIGLERISAISEKSYSIAQMQRHSEMINIMCDALLHPSMSKSSIGRESLHQALLMVDALIYIDLYRECNLKYNHGINNHYNRIFKQLGRSLKSLGISADIFASSISALNSGYIENTINTNLLQEQVNNELVGYV